MIDFLWEARYWLILISWFVVILLFRQQRLLRLLRESLQELCLFVEGKSGSRDQSQEGKKEKLLRELEERLGDLREKLGEEGSLIDLRDIADISELVSQLKMEGESIS